MKHGQTYLKMKENMQRQAHRGAHTRTVYKLVSEAATARERGDLPWERRVSFRQGSGLDVSFLRNTI